MERISGYIFNVYNCQICDNQTTTNRKTQKQYLIANNDCFPDLQDFQGIKKNFQRRFNWHEKIVIQPSIPQSCTLPRELKIRGHLSPKISVNGKRTMYLGLTLSEDEGAGFQWTPESHPGRWCRKIKRNHGDGLFFCPLFSTRVLLYPRKKCTLTKMKVVIGRRLFAPSEKGDGSLWKIPFRSKNHVFPACVRNDFTSLSRWNRNIMEQILSHSGGIYSKLCGGDVNLIGSR